MLDLVFIAFVQVRSWSQFNELEAGPDIGIESHHILSQVIQVVNINQFHSESHEHILRPRCHCKRSEVCSMDMQTTPSHKIYLQDIKAVTRQTRVEITTIM